ncbi:MAG: bifunctional precorrin-2 dehydrogenase/sirohydrochlorin ferrochelatase [Chloroflexi bacterium]|nr:bifunctional precorrin-2 dehydrogenase/sirohydrochlorin ferrochelatase [Chloroflexota bacterium]
MPKSPCRLLPVSQRAYLPMVLNMQGRTALVVGGGPAAADKAAYLADFGIHPTVLIEPEEAVDEGLQALADEGQAELRRTPYDPAHLDGQALVIIATGDRAHDRTVADDARSRGAIVNVVDDPEACDVFAVGYVRRGPVAVSVSTGGRSPAFTATLREHLDDVLGSDIEDHLDHYVRWRERVRRAVSGFGSRERLWRELRAAGLYKVLRRDGPEAAGQLVDAAIARHQADDSAS